MKSDGNEKKLEISSYVEMEAFTAVSSFGTEKYSCVFSLSPEEFKLNESGTATEYSGWKHILDSQMDCELLCVCLKSEVYMM